MGVSGRKREAFYYACRKRYQSDLKLPKCETPPIAGRELEQVVWAKISEFLSDPRAFMAEMDRRRSNAPGNGSEIREYIASLKRKAGKVDEMETELVDMKLRGHVSEEAYLRQSALLRAERSHHNDEIRRQEAVLEARNQSDGAIESLIEARNRIADKLTTATKEERRWV